MAIDRGSGTTKIYVDGFGTCPHSGKGRLRHSSGIAAKNLNLDRHSGWRQAAVVQFRNIAFEDLERQWLDADPQEF